MQQSKGEKHIFRVLASANAGAHKILQMNMLGLKNYTNYVSMHSFNWSLKDRTNFPKD